MITDLASRSENYVGILEFAQLRKKYNNDNNNDNKFYDYTTYSPNVLTQNDTKGVPE